MDTYYNCHELVAASQNGDLERVKHLCQQEGYPFPKLPSDCQPNTHHERSNSTPIHRACRYASKPTSAMRIARVLAIIILL